MINLLPEEAKKHIKAARTNYILIRYVVVICISIVFLFGAIFGSYVYLTDIIKKPVNTSNTNSPTPNNEISVINNNLTKASSALNAQISYSKIISSFMSALPENVIIESPLTINSNAIDGPITIKAYLKSDLDEIALKKQFENSGVFTNYSAQKAIKNTSTNAANYPLTIDFSITINKEMVR